MGEILFRSFSQLFKSNHTGDRTLISGIAPQSSNGSVSYAIQYGYLTTTILNNWASDLQSPTQWHLLRRTPFITPASIDGTQQTFRGQ